MSPHIDTNETVELRLADGTGFGPKATVASYLRTGFADLVGFSIMSPSSHTSTKVDPGVALKDINGDGLADLVVGYQIHYAKVGTADQITGITNGLGATTTITYERLDEPNVYTEGSGATYPLREVFDTAKFDVVSQVSADDGIGGTRDTSYHYAEGKVDVKQGFLGFATVTSTDVATGIKSITDYNQIYLISAWLCARNNG